MDPLGDHLLMSVSKSLIGCVTGVLVDRGAIDVDAAVTNTCPSCPARGTPEPSVRHLLDMRSGVRFSRHTWIPTRKCGCWNRSSVGRRAGTMSCRIPCTSSLPHLSRKPRTAGHSRTDPARATSSAGYANASRRRRMPELLSELLWSKLRPEQDMDAAVDPAGAVMHDGGLCATCATSAASDRCCWTTAASPASRSFRHGGSTTRTRVDQIRAVFAASLNVTGSTGMYRNQFWVPYSDRGALLCLGIHGQRVYVEQAPSRL